jgi:hypothetical protein
MQKPSQPVRGSPVSCKPVEFTMTRREPALRAELLEQVVTVVRGLVPGRALEALIARLEAVQ